MENITDILTKSSEYAQQGFNPILNKILLAIIIVLLGLIIGRVVNKLVELLFKELEFDKILKKAGVKFSLGKLIANVLKNIIYALSLIIGLNQIGITSVVFNVLVVVIVAVVIISLILGFKDFMPKFVSGVRIKNKKIIREGDFIQFNDIQGIVKEVTLIETIIETKMNELLYIPNNILLEGKLKIKRKRKTAKSSVK